MLLFTLIFSLTAQAQWPEAWRAQLDGSPVAVAFDVAGESLLVSVQDGDRARLDRYSLKGAVEARGLMVAEGRAGAVARYDRTVFWLVSGAVKRFTLPNGKLEPVTSLPGSGFRSLTVNRQGEPVADDAPAVFLLVDELFVVRGKNSLATAKATERLCQRACRGLARSSEGEWITLDGNSVTAAKGGNIRTLFRMPFAADGIAYVFRKDQTQERLIAWSGEQKLLVAYEVPKKGEAQP